MILEAVSLAVGALGVALGAGGWALAKRWERACKRCRILIARKGKVVLDAPLVEWIAWNEALPRRERDRGGIIFHANGVRVALARPKIGPASAEAKTKTVREPAARAAAS